MMEKKPDAFQTHSSIAPIGLVIMEGAKELGGKIEDYLLAWSDDGAEKLSVDCDCPRFASGDSKGLIRETVRGKDLFFLVDIGNYSIKYPYYGQENAMSPDDHYQDLKRLIQAVGGKAHRINVIMPSLYGGRQHRRNYRESLDCAWMLQELHGMGVENIITFDAHDPNIANAIPLMSFENVFPTYSILKQFVNNEGNTITKDNMLVISPDTGAMDRAVYYASVLGLDVGLFYKRRDRSVIINGKNPIIQHEYIGRKVEGKDVIIVDDMIASGESMLDVMRELKARNARRIYAVSSFAFFTEGIEKFKKAYEEGVLTRLYTTNLSYVPHAYQEYPWICVVDLSKFVAKIIATLHADHSLSPLLNSTDKIQSLLNRLNEMRGAEED